MFDRLYVAVLDNPSKRPLFTVEERVELLKEATADLPSVRCESFRAWSWTTRPARNADVIVRGVRSRSDFEYELQMASMNKQLAPDMETLFLPTAAAVRASQLQPRQRGGRVRRARGPVGARRRVPPAVRQTARERRCGPMNRMNLLLLLDRLEQMVQEAPRMPIGHRALINAREMLDMIDKIRESLPEEVRRADRLASETERVMDGSRSEGGAHDPRGGGVRGQAGQRVGSAAAGAGRSEEDSGASPAAGARDGGRCGQLRRGRAAKFARVAGTDARAP